MLRIPVAQGRPPLLVRLDRDVPYPPQQVRSVTLGLDAGRLYLDVTAEVPVATYPDGSEPDPARVAGVDLGIIHPYAVAGPGGQQLLVSGRTIRAEARHLRRVRQAQHEAAKAVVAWAVEQQAGMLAVGDPRGVLTLDAGRRHNLRKPAS